MKNSSQNTIDINDDIKNKNGFYLVLEGVDFCGKSTIANELV